MADVFYILSLVFTPALLRQFEMALQEVMWVWYLVPIYLAITFGNWLALRDPVRNDSLVQTMIAIWGLLIPTHIFTVWTGIEPLTSGIRLGVFAFIMTIGLGYFYLSRQEPVPAK